MSDEVRGAPAGMVTGVGQGPIQLLSALLHWLLGECNAPVGWSTPAPGGIALAGSSTMCRLKRNSTGIPFLRAELQPFSSCSCPHSWSPPML